MPFPRKQERFLLQYIKNLNRRRLPIKLYYMIVPSAPRISATSVCSRGFSLVELSIVLVILGLLVGGVLSGQSLIRAAEVRSYITDTVRYRTAVLSFRDKYMALPGDMSNATQFWGVLAGTGSDNTCFDTQATGLPTCNGNGNAVIDGTTGSLEERSRFFQHLANAGLIEGSYTGRTASPTLASYTFSVGVNVPALKANTTFTVVNNGASAPTVGGFQFYTPVSNLFEFRRTTTSQPLKPEEAWNIDTKIDDSKPATGFVLGPQSTWTQSPNCTSSDDPATAQYAVATISNICRLNILFP